MVHHDSDTLTNKDIATKVNVVYYNAIINKLPTISVAIIILILHLSVSDVCESGRSREDVRPELKTFLFLHRRTWTLHVAAH